LLVEANIRCFSLCNGKGDAAGLIEADSTSSRRRQVDVSTAYPRAAIVDADCNASVVADDNPRTKRQGTMCGRHCRTIQALAIRGPATAQTVSPAVNARYLGVREAARRKRQHYRNHQSRNTAKQTNAHLH